MKPSSALPLADRYSTSLDDPTRVKIEGLLQWFRSQGNVLVALSGGVDSSVVAALAKIALNDKAVAVTVKSLTLSASDLDAALKIVGFTKIRHIIVTHDELANSRVAENPPDRCYYCRSELVSVLRKIASSEGIETLVDGTNTDDLKGWLSVTLS